ncbi:MAG: nitroreductase family protein [Fretibacterium sp.]|nr:nitroreductase family protein [Fretibacterium sp.]
MNFLELAKSRYSCRKFSDRAVEKEKIDKIIEAAIAAPTAKNLQPWKLWVLQSEKAMTNVKEVTACHFGASVVLAVGGYAKDAWVRPFDQRNFEDVDAAIVGTHIMMAVQDMGLGTTWVGFFDAPKMKKLFPEMAEYDLVALFPIGYPADDATPADRHSQRKAKEEIVCCL